jgi:aspartate kinase
MKQDRECRRRIVVKYGGTSLANHKLLSKAAQAVAQEVAKGVQTAVVVSAIGKTTNTLLKTARNSSNGHVGKKELDDILAMGERTAIRIFAAALNGNGVTSHYFDPLDAQWPIVTDDAFSNAHPLLDECRKRIKEHVLPLMQHNTIPVIAGFVGKTLDGKITTLGRGGSDTTALILADALDADEAILVTNADGIMSADPNIVAAPRTLPQIDVDTLTGIADSGTKFIHRKALRYKNPAIDVKVVSNNHGLTSSGTLLTGALSTYLDVILAHPAPTMSITVVGRGISKEPEIVLELARTVKSHASLLGLSLNYDSIILYVSQDEPEIRRLLEDIHHVVLKHEATIAMSVHQRLAFLKVKGMGLEETPGVIGKITETLRQNDLNIFGILTITSSILLFVDWVEKDTVQELIRNALRRETA